MPNEEEQRERYREVGEELGVRGGHAVAFAVHLFRPLLLNQPLEQKIERLAPHLSSEHEQDFHFARCPYQRHVDDAEGLRCEREPGAEVGYGIVRVVVYVR